MNKKKFFSFVMVCTIGAGLVWANTADAQLNLGTDQVHEAGMTAGYERAGETTLAMTVGRIVRAFLSMVGILFTVLILYAGFLWMTARGNDEQVTKARKIIQGSIIGLIIALASFSISEFVVNAILESTAGSTVGSPTP